MKQPHNDMIQQPLSPQKIRHFTKWTLFPRLVVPYLILKSFQTCLFSFSSRKLKYSILESLSTVNKTTQRAYHILNLIATRSDELPLYNLLQLKTPTSLTNFVVSIMLSVIITCKNKKLRAYPILFVTRDDYSPNWTPLVLVALLIAKRAKLLCDDYLNNGPFFLVTCL